MEKGRGRGNPPRPYFYMSHRIYDRELETAGRRLGTVSQLLLDQPWSMSRCPTPTPPWPDQYWHQVQARLHREWTRIDTESGPD